jgi:hypothetical protein
MRPVSDERVNYKNKILDPDSSASDSIVPNRFPATRYDI